MWNGCMCIHCHSVLPVLFSSSWSLRHPTVLAKALCFQAVSLACSSVCSFIQTDLVSTMFHERLVQSRWNLRGIFTSLYWYTDDLIRFWRSKVKVTAGRWVGEGIYVDASWRPSSNFIMYCHCYSHFLKFYSPSGQDCHSKLGKILKIDFLTEIWARF